MSGIICQSTGKEIAHDHHLGPNRLCGCEDLTRCMRDTGFVPVPSPEGMSLQSFKDEVFALIHLVDRKVGYGAIADVLREAAREYKAAMILRMPERRREANRRYSRTEKCKEARRRRETTEEYKAKKSLYNKLYRAARSSGRPRGRPRKIPNE